MDDLLKVGSVVRVLRPAPLDQRHVGRQLQGRNMHSSEQRAVRLYWDPVWHQHFFQRMQARLPLTAAAAAAAVQASETA